MKVLYLHRYIHISNIFDILADNLIAILVITMNDKVSVKVFMPVGVCSCSLSSFLGNIYQAVGKHKDVVEYSEDIATSETARKVGVGSQGVLVGTQYFEGTISAEKLENTILHELSAK